MGVGLKAFIGRGLEITAVIDAVGRGIETSSVVQPAEPLVLKIKGIKKENGPLAMAFTGVSGRVLQVLILLHFISIKLEAAMFPPQVLYFGDFLLHVSGSHFSWKYTLLPAH